MTRRRLAWVLAVVGTLLLAILAGRPPDTGASSWSRGSHGLMGAARYLEARGVAVQRWQRPLSELQAPGTLLVALPTRVGATEDDLAALDRWFEAGGSLVLLPSGEDPGVGETRLLEHFDFSMREVDTLELPSWTEFRERSWRHTELWADGGTWLPEPVVVRSTTHVLSAWRDPPVLSRDDQGRPRIVERLVGPGRVLLIDNATAFGNAWLGQGQNLVLLEAVVSELGGPLYLDEWHHGYQDLQDGEQNPAAVAMTGLMVHLGGLYLLVVWSLSRRFGPPLASTGPVGGTAARDLWHLAQLHKKRGHAQGAGETLLRSAHQLQRELDLPERFEGGEAELLALARQIGEGQDHAPAKRSP